MTEEIRKQNAESLPKEPVSLKGFRFLTPETMWEGEADGWKFVAFAEDRGSSDTEGSFLAVREDGPVYVGSLADLKLTQYCNENLQKFMDILGKWDNMQTFRGWDLTEEERNTVRKQMCKLFIFTIPYFDRSASKNLNSFWCILAKELLHVYYSEEELEQMRRH